MIRIEEMLAKGYDILHDLELMRDPRYMAACHLLRHDKDFIASLRRGNKIGDSFYKEF
jgi:hypothetical protein